tara:strand:+ start:102 stop:431 length:330 start_codon:yes stop_codon:yes gene_type:complete
MKKISDKQKKEKRLLSIVYNQLSEERGHYCTGCGRTTNLSHSHLIPRSRRKDLVTDKRNITYHCVIGPNGTKGCHQIWESKERTKLLDYCKNMEYILEVDTEYYFLITE